MAEIGPLPDVGSRGIFGGPVASLWGPIEAVFGGRPEGQIRFFSYNLPA